MQARKSAASAALDTAEGAARQTLADKSRAYAIALAECCECCAAVEVAGALGACAPAHVQAVVELGTLLKEHAQPARALSRAAAKEMKWTMLALFRSISQRTDERRSVPWKTLVSELSFALVTTTQHQLPEPLLR